MFCVLEISIMCMLGAWGGQEREWDPPELKLQRVVSCRVVPRIKLRPPGRTVSDDCCWAVSPAFVSLVIDVFKLEIAFSWFLDLHNNVKGAVWWNKGRKIAHFARWRLVPPVLRASLLFASHLKKNKELNGLQLFEWLHSATVTVPQENKNKNKSLIAICVASALNWDRITCLTTQNNSQCLFVVFKSLAPKGSQAVARVL